MQWNLVGTYLERLGLILGGAFIGLGAQLRGWIEYNLEFEFWLMPILLGFIVLGHYLRNKSKSAVTGVSDNAA